MSQHTVLVTGATGYVAGWLVKALLDAGCTVHAAVRDPGDAAKTAPLRALAEAAPGEIRFFKADLLQDGAYDAAMAGCRVVFHTASPFAVSVRDVTRDLLDPAIKGTANVLHAADRTESVTRVVLTSSVAAVYGDNADILAAPGGRIDESMWNETSSPARNPYSYSKTMAELEAWKIARAQSRWRLVTVNPALVVGPALHGKPSSESFRIVKAMGDGSLMAGAPRWGVGAVDVRDVAAAHVAAGFSAGAHGRNIVAGHETDMFAMAQELVPKYGARYPLPRVPAPKWLLWLASPLLPGLSHETVSRNVDVPWRADRSKAMRELGLTYRPLRASMEEMFAQMIEAGTLRKA